MDVAFLSCIPRALAPGVSRAMLPSEGEPEEEQVPERNQWNAAAIAELLTVAGYPTRVDDSDEQGRFRFVCWDLEDTVQMVSPLETEDIERRLNFLFPRWCEKHGMDPEDESARVEFEFSPQACRIAEQEFALVDEILESTGLVVERDYTDGLPIRRLYGAE